ncbi:MAG: DUF4124 domain-containing protein [Methylobacter sp.]|nr:MAG: DUF4124 domain-containing protein [Methylobacter sp.]
MKKLFFMLLILLASSVHAAEVFKCQLASGKTVYQSTPCQSAVKQQAIEIQDSDPHKVAEEEAKLKAWKEDFTARKEATIKAEKELQAERDRRASVEALQKSADYEQQQAFEEKRQADALEQQRMQSPALILPSYGYQAPPIYPSYTHHRHNIQGKTFPNTQQPGQPEPTTGKNKDDNSHTNSIFKWE